MLDPEEIAARRATAVRGARFTADGGAVRVGAHIATTPSRSEIGAQLAALGARIAALSAAAKRARG
jgi:hypothetical protein